VPVNLTRLKSGPETLLAESCSAIACTPELPGKVEVITWLPDADNSSTGRLIAQFVDGTEKE